MPAKKKANRYSIDGKKYKSFSAAAEFAIDLSIQQQTQATIVEHNPNTGKTFYIGVTAVAEEA